MKSHSMYLNSCDRRGTILTITIVLYTLTSFVAGLVSGHYYKKHGGREWTKCIF
jgi:hypothetical protein